MINYKIEQYQVGAIGTNCYFLINTDTKKMVVIDPGDNAGMLTEKIKERGLTPEAVLLTHGHFDHTMASAALAETFGVKIYAHEDEKATLEDPKSNVSPMLGEKMVFHADEFFRDGDVLEFAGFRLKVLHTPGHTVGGVCFYEAECGILFSGDSLFCESVGRTDFPGGSASQLIRSIQDKLMVLPDETKVYPGHNSLTSIGQERKYNPYL